MDEDLLKPRWPLFRFQKISVPLLGIAHPVEGIYFSGTEDALGNGTHSGP